jgi:hypothetical protein
MTMQQQVLHPQVNEVPGDAELVTAPTETDVYPQSQPRPDAPRILISSCPFMS